ncbi:class I SAM-dependent methyltransferase [Cystobacter fuscus]|uniref:class I SAM-dependent methyltransferase n=1 Tax=Cystobacter fuscus TaxID=43 RepID=UPI002B31C0AD|nr:class I SAM-dependent methyltransferase [Cystobacter fuscus]
MPETVSSSTLIPRIHLFELADQSWYPQVLRDFGTDYLHALSELMGVFDAATEVLARGLRAAETPEVLDLGAGGSGPLLRLCRLLKQEQGLEPRVVLSDPAPSVHATEQARAHGVPFLEPSVDVMRVPSELRGMRTLFNALHHFRPEQVERMLADAQEKRVPFAAFEVVRRTPTGLLTALPVPLLVWLLTPFVRPLTPLRLLLTYVLPLTPLILSWDGLVSALRAHSPQELRALTASIAREGYTWEVGEVRKPGKPTVSYVLGLPERSAPR